MTDEEYRELLDALGRRHLRLGVLDRHGPMGELHHLAYDLDRLSSLSRFVKVVAERSEDRRLYKPLGDELENAYIGSVTHAMERAGVIDALDDAAAVVFQNLRRSAIPDEDQEILRRAGVEDPEAEITLIVHYTRHHVGMQDMHPSTITATAEEEAKRIGKRLQQMGESTEDEFKASKKPRKLFIGIGRILAGAVTGAGNLLLGAGTIAAPNPALAYAVIGSAALAIGSMSQGIGDFRDE